MIRTIAAAVMVFMTAAPHADAQDLTRKYMNDGCIARVANTPSLRHDLLPSARFRLVETLQSSQADEAGHRVETYFKSAEETARLPGDVNMKVRLGGCETYSMIYEFRLPKSPRRLSDRRYWLAQSARLMAEVRSVTVAQPIEWARLNRDLLRASGSKNPHASGMHKVFDWEMAQGGHDGVGVTTYRVHAEHQARADVLTLSYYVSL